MDRIAVVGATGSGKTSLAMKIAQRLKITHMELDAVYWGPNWDPIPLDQFRHQVDTFTLRDQWVIDGNYRKVRDFVWGRADTLMWLDYPFLIVFWRLLKRSIPRVFLRIDLWNGNRESFKNMFLSRDSIFVWLFQSYRHQKKNYPMFMTEPLYTHLTFIRLKTPRQTDKWIKSLPNKL